MCGGQAYGGTKCSLGRLFELLEPLGVPQQDLWGRVAEVATAALFAAVGPIAPMQLSDAARETHLFSSAL